MDRESDGEEGRLKAAADANRELDLANAELSGTLSEGYIGKRLPDDHDSKASARERKAEKKKDAQSRLDRLLADPVYAALYNETSDMLRDAEIQVQAALEQAVDTLTKAEGGLNDVLDSANTLPDGTKVFRDEDGTVFDENGNPVTGDNLASIEWKDDAPSYADYLKAKQTVTDAQTRVDDLRRIQDKLGGYRNRLEDPDNPPTPPELRGIQHGINADLTKASLETGQTHTAELQPAHGIKLPPLSS